MSLLLYLLYGFISGFAEFLPISTQAHQALFLQLSGQDGPLHLLDLFVHIAMLIAVYYANSSVIGRIRRENRLGKQRRRFGSKDRSKSMYDLKLVRSAALPMLVMLLLNLVCAEYAFQPVMLSVFLVLNGVILIIPEYMRHANKDARMMSGLDGIALGLLSGFSFLPGVSRIGLGLSYSSMRGADRQHSMNWVMLLSIPALLLFILFDLIAIFRFGVGAVSFLTVICCLLASATAFLGSYLGVMSLRMISDRAGFSAFAYYSWGVALFTFALYLIT